MIEDTEVKNSMKEANRFLFLCGRKRTEEETRPAAENLLREQGCLSRQQGASMLEKAKVF